MQMWKVGFKIKTKERKKTLQIRIEVSVGLAPETRSRADMNMLPERQCHSVSNENPEVKLKPLYLRCTFIKKKILFFFLSLSFSQKCIIVGQWIQTMPTESDLAPTDTTHYQVYYHLHQTPQFKIITINIPIVVVYIYVCTCKQKQGTLYILLIDGSTPAEGKFNSS